MINRKLFSLILVVSLALPLLASACTASKPSQLPDHEQVRKYLAHLAGQEKRTRGRQNGIAIEGDTDRFEAMKIP